MIRLLLQRFLVQRLSRVLRVRLEQVVHERVLNALWLRALFDVVYGLHRLKVVDLQEGV